MASKLKSIVACISVTFYGYENEVINLLSRIKKNTIAPKPRVQRTPPATIGSLEGLSLVLTMIGSMLQIVGF